MTVPVCTLVTIAAEELFIEHAYGEQTCRYCVICDRERRPFHVLNATTGDLLDHLAAEHGAIPQ